ncbi:RNA polymerase sigma-70 factor (ECF subfamily) [Prauserella sediminis]|uniref:RNA polymerase sigma-70 factor (ECF subfamily) n=1 Tax=Prauserella sediminis TaxID=577680 RepID=A0A839XLN4_9PSEU|nr:RNA polymerase sigma-70 factor [Prauserella sediminis]MBB3664170.1 RNA polymerase sigma-70 factor (ECF subfamily) [Prauserella sediminis]
MSIADEHVRTFEEARGRLSAIAYRMLGTVADAEDAVQDTYVRWSGAEHGDVREPVAWLTRVLTNVCLNRLTSARARREEYVGPWLPEPVVTEEPLTTLAERESVSMAMLVVLERLTPPQRAVFVLREAFGHSHAEIAAVLDITEVSSQQLYRRARGHVADGRARFTTSAEECRRITERFLSAARGGDQEALRSLFVEDVVAWADGGGKTTAARRPVSGADRVTRYLAWMSRDIPGLVVDLPDINGTPGVVASIDGVTVLAVSLHIVDGAIADIYLVANPDKLARLVVP